MRIGTEYSDLPSTNVSRIWREYHTFLALSCVHAVFLKIDDFHTFFGFSSHIHPKFCTISSITDFLVCIFLPSNVLQNYFCVRVHVLTESITVKQCHAKSFENLFLGSNIVYFRKEILGSRIRNYGPEEKFMHFHCQNLAGLNININIKNTSIKLICQYQV